MSKLLYTRQDTNGHCTTFLSGLVEKIIDPEPGDKKPFRLTVKTRAQRNDGSKKWDDISIDLAGWEKRIDYMRKMKFDVGSYALFRIGDINEYSRRDGNTILQAQYWSSIYTGYWEIDDPQRPDLVVVSGTPTEITENADGSACIVVKARSFIDGERTDLFFNLNVKANTYHNMTAAGFNKYCSVIAVGDMIDDASMNVGIIDFYNKPKRSNGNNTSGTSKGAGRGRGSSGGSRGSGSRNTPRKWGSTASSFDDDE